MRRCTRCSRLLSEQNFLVRRTSRMMMSAWCVGCRNGERTIERQIVIRVTANNVPRRSWLTPLSHVLSRTDHPQLLREIDEYVARSGSRTPT